MKPKKEVDEKVTESEVVQQESQIDELNTDDSVEESITQPDNDEFKTESAEIESVVEMEVAQVVQSPIEETQMGEELVEARA